MKCSLDRGQTNDDTRSFKFTMDHRGGAFADETTFDYLFNHLSREFLWVVVRS